MSATKTTNTTLRVVNHLMKYDRTMPISALQVFLYAYRQAGVEGALVRDIVKATGMNQSSVARHLAYLGDSPVRGEKQGLGWVQQRPDMEDPRRVRIFITPAGERFVAETSTIIET